MNKLIQLALFFTLMLTGCSNSSTSSESKVETTVKTTAAFPQKELEKELKKLKPVSLDMKFESPLATELGKRKAKEEAEKQRQIAAEKKLAFTLSPFSRNLIALRNFVLKSCSSIVGLNRTSFKLMIF